MRWTAHMQMPSSDAWWSHNWQQLLLGTCSLLLILLIIIFIIGICFFWLFLLAGIFHCTGFELLGLGHDRFLAETRCCACCFGCGFAICLAFCFAFCSALALLLGQYSIAAWNTGNNHLAHRCEFRLIKQVAFGALHHAHRFVQQQLVWRMQAAAIEPHPAVRSITEVAL